MVASHQGGESPRARSKVSVETYQIVNPGDIVLGHRSSNDHTSLRVGMRARSWNHHPGLPGVRAVGTARSLVRVLVFSSSMLQDTSKAIYGYGSGASSNSTSRHFKEMPVPVPPPDEQAAIVRFLDWANGRLERAIRAKRKVIALLNEQKQAIIHRAVTRGLDPYVPLKPSGIPWLGDIPKHWEVLAHQPIRPSRKRLNAISRQARVLEQWHLSLAEQFAGESRAYR